MQCESTSIGRARGCGALVRRIMRGNVADVEPQARVSSLSNFRRACAFMLRKFTQKRMFRLRHALGGRVCTPICCTPPTAVVNRHAPASLQPYSSCGIGRSLFLVLLSPAACLESASCWLGIVSVHLRIRGALPRTCLLFLTRPLTLVSSCDFLCFLFCHARLAAARH